MAVRRGAVPKPFNFPLKGLDENWSENAQPAGTSPRLNNVVPYHPTSGRATGGPRGGSILKTVINAGFPIQCIRQVVEVGQTHPTFEDDFNYSTGSFDLVDAVDAGAHPLWQCRKKTSAGEICESLNATICVSGDFDIEYIGYGAGVNAAGYHGEIDGLVANPWSARYIGPTPAIPTHKYTVDLHVDGLSTNASHRIGLLARINGAASANVITLQIRSRRFVEILEGTTVKDTWDNGSDLGNHVFHLELRANGNAFTGWLDGTQRVSATCTGAPTAKGFGVGGRLAGIVYDLVVTPQGGTPGRIVTLAVVCNGDIYMGDFDNGFSIPTGGTGALTPGNRVQATDLLGKVYFCDGVGAIKVLDLTAQTVTDLTATGGKGTAPTNATLLTVYRERLCVSGVSGDTQNLFMSRQGDPKDWDDGQEDAQAAVALNANSTSGRVGSPILALVPYHDDTMLIFCDHSLYKMSGDPAPNAGGSIDTISDLVGILDPNAWTFDAGGTLYFLGTGGFYQLEGESPPVPVSDKHVQKRFTGFTRTPDQHFTTVWDRDRGGVMIFASSDAGGGTHHWYDAGFEGFFPITLPTDQGPTCAIVFDGDGPSDRYLILGGIDGCLYELGDEHTHDETNALGSLAINSSVVCGPLPFADIWSAAAMVSTWVITSVSTTNLVWKIYTGNDAIAALASVTPAVQGTFTTGGKQSRSHTRARGSSFLLELSNTVIDKTWGLEQFVCEVEDAGPAR